MDNEIRTTTPKRSHGHYLREMKHEVRRLRMAVTFLAAVVLALVILFAIRAVAAEDPVFEHKVAQCADYIGVEESGLAGTGKEWTAARIIVTASRDAKLEAGWEILAALAHPESSFNINAVNKRTHCRGLLQIHPCWREPMAAAGLSFYNPQDNTLWGAMMIQNGLNHGETLYQALHPWAVRSKALMEEYENIKKATR
jgi:soluble lytic murein transglycosylase-like protein